jgi:hypothetical protein
VDRVSDCGFCGGGGHTRYGCPVADEMFKDLKKADGADEHAADQVSKREAAKPRNPRPSEH